MEGGSDVRRQIATLRREKDEAVARQQVLNVQVAMLESDVKHEKEERKRALDHMAFMEKQHVDKVMNLKYEAEKEIHQARLSGKELASKELEKLKHSNKVLREMVGVQQQMALVYKEDFEKKRHDREELAARMEEQRTQLDMSSRKLEEALMNERVDSEGESHRAGSFAFANLKQDMQTLEAERNQLRKELKAKSSQAEIVTVEKENLFEEVARLNRHKDEQEGQILQMITQLEASRTHSDELQDGISASKEELAGKTQQVKQYYKQVKSLGQDLEASRSQCDQLVKEVAGLKETLAGKTQLVKQYSKQAEDFKQQAVTYKTQYEVGKLSWDDMKKEFDVKVTELNQRIKAECTSAKMKFDRSAAMEELAHYRIIHVSQPLEGDTFFRAGSYGAVYRVQVNSIPCIAKKIHDILVGREREEAVSDEQKLAIQLKFQCLLLSRMRHPNIVQFMGVQYPDHNPLDLTLIMEFLPMELEKCLKKHPNLPLPIKLSILLDVSYGLLHLHNAGIIHRDLSAANVLLTPDMRAKITDFGVSKILEMDPRQMTKQSALPGALGYMPPEALWEIPEYATKLDIFSFGVLALFVGVQVYPQFYDLKKHEPRDSEQIRKRMKWIRMLPENGCNCLHNLICECLQDGAAQRPTTERLNITLKQLNQINPRQFTSIVYLEEELAQQKQYMAKLKEEIRNHQEGVRNSPSDVRNPGRQRHSSEPAIIMPTRGLVRFTGQASHTPYPHLEPLFEFGAPKNGRNPVCQHCHRQFGANDALEFRKHVSHCKKTQAPYAQAI